MSKMYICPICKIPWDNRIVTDLDENHEDCSEYPKPVCQTCGKIYDTQEYVKTSVLMPKKGKAVKYFRLTPKVDEVLIALNKILKN